MKKMLGVALVGIGMVLASSLPAMADVEVYAEINKYKNVDVTEDIYVNKTVKADIDVKTDTDSAAESATYTNSNNYENYVDTNSPDTEAIIDSGAFDGAAGINLVNQAPGQLNNQGNAVSVAAIVGTGTALTHAQASTELDSWDNIIYQDETLTEDIIDAAFIGVGGITAVNQSAGNANSQHNAIALAVGTNYVALSEADLGQDNYSNEVYVTDPGEAQYHDFIQAGAFGGATGITTVNQSAGNGNSQANVVSVAASIAP